MTIAWVWNIEHPAMVIVLLAVLILPVLQGVPAVRQVFASNDASVSDDSSVIAREKIKEGKYEEALTLLSPYASDPGKNQEAVSDYIVVLIWSGKSDEAIKHFKALPETFPRRVYLLRNVAKAYYEKSEFLESGALYEQALELSPDDKEAQKGVVLSLVSDGRNEKALEYIDDFLLTNPDLFFLHIKKAEILLEQGQYMDAFKIFRLTASMKGADSAYIFKVRDDLIAGLSPEKGRALADDLREVKNLSEEVLRDYVLALILQRDYQAALQTFESSQLDSGNLSAHLLSWVAWAYFQTDNTGKAKVYYEQLLSSRPGNAKARIGLAYCYAKEKDPARANQIFEELLSETPGSLEVMFAQAYMYEKSGMFLDAIEVYDRILTISRGNRAAKKLRILASSDLGASSHSNENAIREFPQDVPLHEKIKGDMAADRITWKEFPGAIEMLHPLLDNESNIRARYDYIVARVENEDMQYAVRVY